MGEALVLRVCAEYIFNKCDLGVGKNIENIVHYVYFVCR